MLFDQLSKNLERLCPILLLLIRWLIWDGLRSRDTLAYLGWSSFPSSFNTDPFRTSTHTSSNNLTVMLRTSLCLNDTRPLFLQDNACATLNDDPHTQVDGIRSRGQLLTDSDFHHSFDIIISRLQKVSEFFLVSLLTFVS